MEYETKESHDERAKDIKIEMTISGQKTGSSDGEPMFGPRTKEIKVVDTKRGDEKVIDADSFPGMKSQFTWFMKDRVRKVTDNGSEYTSDLMVSSWVFERAYKALKSEVKGVFMEHAPENEETSLPEWFEEKSDVDFKVTGELTLNSRDQVEVARQDGNDGEGYTLTVEEPEESGTVDNLEEAVQAIEGPEGHDTVEDWRNTLNALKPSDEEFDGDPKAWHLLMAATYEVQENNGGR